MNLTRPSPGRAFAKGCGRPTSPIGERLEPGLLPSVALSPALAAQATRLLGPDAVQDGKMLPTVVLAEPDSGLLCEDIFFPVLSLVPVASMAEALALDAACPYRLGAAIFGPEKSAQNFSQHVAAGMVVINDLIAPTADPRLPFEGAGHSGFGPTRGAEGLLAMTRLQAVTVARGSLRPHHKPVEPRHAGFYLSYVQAVHGGGWRNIGRFLQELRRFKP